MIYENEVKKENKSLYLTMRLHISQTIHCYSTSISINLSLRMVTASAMSLTPRVFIHSAVRSTDIKSFPSTRYASKTRKEKLSGPGETCQNNVSESDTGPFSFTRMPLIQWSTRHINLMFPHSIHPSYFPPILSFFFVLPSILPQQIQLVRSAVTVVQRFERIPF